MKKTAMGVPVSAETMLCRRLPVGAEVVAPEGIHFRVWAPKASEVTVIVENRAEGQFDLAPEGDGYFSGLHAGASAGMLYRYRLDGLGPYPDPASRFQPKGPHGPSEVIDPSVFRWNDETWPGLLLEGQIIYEMHIGTFTKEGTWEAAARELPELARLGITAVEMMPIADFPGRFGWGYDGVNLFAPTRLYGLPDDLRSFVDSAHKAGIGVLLDVVYNHLGPDGCHMSCFSDEYYTDKYPAEWGKPLNFDGKNSFHVREFFIANAGYWIEEFHIDGLRLDATQNIFDSSETHVITEISAAVRRKSDGRATLVIAENESQDVIFLESRENGGHGIDALWNDDFHHSARVALTGRSEAYYTDYRGKPQEFISLAKYGFLYQGQWYSWQKKRRGTPSIGLSPEHFITYLQNHDQIANSSRGERLHLLTSMGRYRAMTAFLLLSPGTPLLFQGQEFAASAPFLFFADLEKELMEKVYNGRKNFLRQFRSLATPEMQSVITNPSAQNTFESCRLDFSEREKHAGIYRLHMDLLKLRREDDVIRLQHRGGCDGSVIGDESFALRFFGPGKNERLLLVNLGLDLSVVSVADPLLASPQEKRWRLLWSSEDYAYGGSGVVYPETEEGWLIPGHSAVLLTSQRGLK